MKKAIVIASLLLAAAVCHAAGQKSAAATNAVPESAFAATNAVPTKKGASAQQRPQCQRPQCAAPTLSGGRCRRRAAAGSIYCRQHEAIMRRRQEQGQ